MRCTLAVDSEAWMLSVEDQGTGLPAARQRPPFTPLAPGRGGGLGLGLALSRLLAEQNGWELSLRPGAARGLRASVRLVEGRR